MPKNIVILSDGTGQVGGIGANTNIYKLFNIVEDRTKDQIVYYDPGIGAISRSPIALGSGLGFSKNVLDCYKFIFENFEAGDQIFLLGFSRGAATVRSLSGLIHLFGILPKSRIDLIEQAYSIYKIINIERRKTKAADFINRHHTMWTRIRFLGVFDTVAALGLMAKPLNRILNLTTRFKLNYHDYGLSKSVEHARHALSIDDERKAFHPILWERKIEESQTLKQVWFPGVHTDVGGGYEDASISDISFDWMIKEATEQGLKIYDTTFPISPNPNGKIHEEKYIFWKLPYTLKVRSWPTQTHEKPLIHRSVLQRTIGRKNDSQPYNPWIRNLDFNVVD